MKPEDLFGQLPGLGDHWYVRSVEYSAASINEVRIVIEECPSLFASLAQSSKVHRIYEKKKNF
jgi:hypothetical protein